MKRKFWTPLKIFVAVPIALCFVFALIALLQDDKESAAGLIGGAMFFGVLFGLLNVDTIFNKT